MSSLSLLNPTQVCLEVDAAMQAAAWQQCEGLATDLSRWTGVLNRLCLRAIATWLQEEYGVRVQTDAGMESVWEFVTGVAVRMGERRLVLLPVESIDLDGFEVPQEWVDIPGWVGDYYLAVQVNLDEAWVRLGGFVTHRQVKEGGLFEANRRVYQVDGTELNGDFGTLWVAQQLCAAEVTRSTVAALEPLPLAQVENLLARLGDRSVLNPRLQVPFQVWAGLMAHGGWRQQLAERRRGLMEQRSLVAWLQSGVSQLAQGWEQVSFQTVAIGARGEGEMLVGTGFSRRLVIADQLYELQVLPVNVNDRVWQLRLQSLTTGGMIPAGFKLRLLTEDLQDFAGNEDVAVNAVETLFVEVALESGEGIVWEVEPLPEGYDREILRF